MATTANPDPAAPQSARTSGVLAQAKGQAGKLADLGIAKVAELADGKKQSAVGQVDAVAQVVRELADTASESFGPAVGTALSRGGDKIEAIARDLEARSVEELVGQGRQTIVRHPGAALAVAALAGFAGGRVLKGAMARRGQAQGSDAKRKGGKA